MYSIPLQQIDLPVIHMKELSTSFCLFFFQAAKALEEKLKASGIPYEVHIYPGNEACFYEQVSRWHQAEEEYGNGGWYWSHSRARMVSLQDMDVPLPASVDDLSFVYVCMRYVHIAKMLL